MCVRLVECGVPTLHLNLRQLSVRPGATQQEIISSLQKLMNKTIASHKNWASSYLGFQMHAALDGKAAISWNRAPKSSSAVSRKAGAISDIPNGRPPVLNPVGSAIAARSSRLTKLVYRPRLVLRRNG